MNAETISTVSAIGDVKRPNDEMGGVDIYVSAFFEAFSDGAVVFKAASKDVYPSASDEKGIWANDLVTSLSLCIRAQSTGSFFLVASLFSSVNQSEDFGANVTASVVEAQSLLEAADLGRWLNLRVRVSSYKGLTLSVNGAQFRSFARLLLLSMSPCWVVKSKWSSLSLELTKQSDVEYNNGNRCGLLSRKPS
jgi:hypothetical protein